MENFAGFQALESVRLKQLQVRKYVLAIENEGIVAGVVVLNSFKNL